LTPDVAAVTPGRLEIGRIIKAHGIRGEVVVEAISNREERFAAGSCLYAGDRALVVVASREHQGRRLLAFDSVFDRTSAEALRGTMLVGDPLDVALDESEVWVHELFGRSVVDLDGTPLGTVTDVLDNPAHEILVLDGRIMIPVVFLASSDGDDLVVDPPPGLLDLYR
jgi:16S rRNA processing protein RimM